LEKETNARRSKSRLKVNIEKWKLQSRPCGANQTINKAIGQGPTLWKAKRIGQRPNKLDKRTIECYLANQ
jgi:hypothetical protein